MKKVILSMFFSLAVLLILTSANDFSKHCKNTIGTTGNCNSCHSNLNNSGSVITKGGTDTINQNTNPHTNAVADVWLDETSVNLYPNPASGFVQVHFAITKDCLMNIELISIDGKTSMSICQKHFNTGEFSEKISLPTSLQSGNYIMAFKTNSGIFTKYLVIK